jgi:hypothetical protein
MCMRLPDGFYPTHGDHNIVWQRPAPRGSLTWSGVHCNQINQYGQLTAVHVGTVYCRRPYPVTYMQTYRAVRLLRSEHRNCE